MKINTNKKGAEIVFAFRNDSGQLHYQHGPAIRYTSDSGFIAEFRINGKLHNEKGAARKYYDKSGKINLKKLEYWINNEQYTKYQYYALKDKTD